MVTETQMYRPKRSFIEAHCLRYGGPYPSHPKKLRSHRTRQHFISTTDEAVFAGGHKRRDEVVNMSNSGRFRA